jgi:hypothetical protein
LVRSRAVAALRGLASELKKLPDDCLFILLLLFLLLSPPASALAKPGSA